jgi:excisionase family DNA binding protein
MSKQAIESKTFLPAQGEDLAPVVSFLAAHEQRRGRTVAPSYALVGADEHDRIEIPREVHQALRQVVDALHAGKAVTVAPQSMTLTTQQTADILGVSRPTVMRLINSGDLAAERIGNRHRLVLDDVLAYRQVRRQRQYDALADAELDIDSDDDPEVIRAQLREARRVVATRRRDRRRA